MNRSLYIAQYSWEIFETLPASTWAILVTNRPALFLPASGWKQLLHHFYRGRFAESDWKPYLWWLAKGTDSISWPVRCLWFLKKAVSGDWDWHCTWTDCSSNTAAFTRLSFDLHQPSDWFAHLYDIKICLWFLLLQYSYLRRVHSQSVPWFLSFTSREQSCLLKGRYALPVKTSYQSVRSIN